MDKADEVQLKTTVPRHVYRRLKVLAAAKGTTLKLLMNQALAALLDMEER